MNGNQICSSLGDGDEISVVNNKPSVHPDNKMMSCVNPNCNKTITHNMLEASMLVSSYYGETKSKGTVVCQPCHEEAMNFFGVKPLHLKFHQGNAESEKSEVKLEPCLLGDNTVKSESKDKETDLKGIIEGLCMEETELVEIEKVPMEISNSSKNILKPGPLVRPLINADEQIYVSIYSYEHNWTKGVVVQTPSDVMNGQRQHNEGGLYTILTTTDEEKFVVKELERRNIAYEKELDGVIKLGTRVIAVLSESHLDDKLFYSATVAEEPSSQNNYRYLLFYDNTCARYVSHGDIRVIYDSSPNSWKSVPLLRRELVERYLRTYKKRKMHKLKPKDKMRLLCEGSPRMAVVLEVDASLANIRYIGGSTEWIYRGSSRIKRVFGCEQTSPENCSKRKISKIHHVGHVCGPKCISNVMVNLGNVKSLSQLEVPLQFGFRRIIQIVNQDTEEKTVKQVVVYIAPCGRELRAMEETLQYLRITKSLFTVDCFNFDYWVRCCTEYKVDEKFIISQDISHGLERNPIKCANEVDSSSPNFDGYMTERKPSRNVKLNTDKEFLCGCDCDDDCQDKTKCACCRMTIDAQRALPNYSINPEAGYKYRRLYENLITGVFECNEQCKCSRTTCLNRVVQLPTLQKLQLFKTEMKGWGVRCLNDIPAGAFVCIYTGYLLTDKTANERGRNFGDEYFAELDYMEMIEKRKEGYESDVPDEQEGLARSMRSPVVPRNIISCSTGRREPRNNVGRVLPSFPGNAISVSYNRSHVLSNSTIGKSSGGICSAISSSNKGKRKGNAEGAGILQNKRSARNTSKYLSARSYYGPGESVYIMDARTNGNIGRYLNHSCNPNLFVQNVFVDTQDLRFPWIAFFARRYIEAGSELTWDYNYEIGSVQGKIMFCHCGSKNCRKRLF